MKELNNKLIKREPLIWEKPFSYLQNTLEQIKEADDENEYLKSEISNSQVRLAIKIFGEDYDNVNEYLRNEHGVMADNIKDTIFYSQFKKLYNQRQINDKTVKELLESTAHLNTKIANRLKMTALLILATQYASNIEIGKQNINVKKKIEKVFELLDEASQYDKSIYYYKTKVRVNSFIILYFAELKNYSKCSEYLIHYEVALNELFDKIKDDFYSLNNHFEQFRIEIASLYEIFIDFDNDFMGYFFKALKQLDEVKNIQYYNEALFAKSDLIMTLLDRLETGQKKEYIDMGIELSWNIIKSLPESFKGYILLSILLTKNPDDHEILESNYLLHQSFHYFKIADELGCGNLEKASYYREINQFEKSAYHLGLGILNQEFNRSILETKKWGKVIELLTF